MQIINGNALAKSIKDSVKSNVEKIKQTGVILTLCVIQVGEDPASKVYVTSKKKDCEYCGINSLSYDLPEHTTQTQLLSLIDKLNKDESVHGILVQLPLPVHINENIIIEAIDPKKDVDGFHPVNVGKMVIGLKSYLPCTPAGVIEMIKSAGIKIAGKECVIIGRSNIVGKPMALLMLALNATVTIAHSKTSNLENICKRADILIVAVGKKKMVNASYIKPGAFVIDVGIHRNEDNTLCGDVDFESVKELCSYITPVPGGVGPMTRAMLMKNMEATYGVAQ